MTTVSIDGFVLLGHGVEIDAGLRNDVSPNAIMAGVPARLIRYRE